MADGGVYKGQTGGIDGHVIPLPGENADMLFVERDSQAVHRAIAHNALPSAEVVLRLTEQASDPVNHRAGFLLNELQKQDRSQQSM